MKLIADIGGTTGRWAVIDDGEVIHQFESAGFHPLQQDAAKLSALITESILWPMREDITTIKYYGTAATVGDSAEIINNVLGACFAFSEIHIHNDIEAIAHASGKEDCIVCILGTGSSSALIRNSKISDRIPSLGYALGDEGSGADLAKRLFKKYYYRRLSDELRDLFEARYGLHTVNFITDFYSSDRPAASLARFTRFIVDHKSQPELNLIIRNAFNEFYSNHIEPYSDEKWPIVNSGGIAFHLKTEWEQILSDNNHSIFETITDPMARLIELSRNESS